MNKSLHVDSVRNTGGNVKCGIKKGCTKDSVHPFIICNLNADSLSGVKLSRDAGGRFRVPEKHAVERDLHIL